MNENMVKFLSITFAKTSKFNVVIILNLYHKIHSAIKLAPSTKHTTLK